MLAEVSLSSINPSLRAAQPWQQIAGRVQSPLRSKTPLRPVTHAVKSMLGVVGPQWNALSISTVAFQAFMLTAVINEAKGQNTGELRLLCSEPHRTSQGLGHCKRARG